MKVFTIGFTRKTAAEFFGLLRQSPAQRVVDVRLNNTSQLSGFAKKDDLAYFLQEICGMDYRHLPELAPTKEMLYAYRQEHRDWNAYAGQFLALMRERRIEQTVPREIIEGACLLCSEAHPAQCHRRLAAEYLDRAWGGLEIVHPGPAPPDFSTGPTGNREEEQ